MAKPRARRVLIAAGAERDLAGLYRRRLAQRGAEGDDGAEALLQRLIAAIESLADFSRRGATPAELEALGIRTYRQISLPPYRIVYLPADDAVTMVVVSDARRDFRTLLEERLLRG